MADDALTPLSLALLVALGAGDLHGYALMRAVEERSGGRLSPGTGSLYAALQRLMDEGLIVEAPDRPEDDDRRRRYYRITDQGKGAVAREADRLERLMADARSYGLIAAKGS
ncbi:MAG: helix-turn-helix transcriptional regulator [Gemmatimonadota bacterium]|jgi:DNA-binding PadR family transcriptional regulator